MTSAPSGPVAVPQSLAFYASPSHECSYLPGRHAVTLFADPFASMDTTAYTALTELGFRRSGRYVYSPRCPECAACVPVRIPVEDFRPDRSLRRNWRRNRDLTVRRRNAAFNEEYFALYRRYIGTRHPGGSMDVADSEQYRDFLESGWGDTRFVEFRAAGNVVAVAVLDYLLRGLSAVYTFFDPEWSDRGLGNYAVLWQIEEARRLSLPFVYLGYWIEDCRKMAYKDRFRPFEAFINGRWQRHD